MRRYNAFLWIVVALSITLGFLIGSNQEVVYNAVRPMQGAAKLNQFINYLDRDYVDKIDTDSLVTAVIQDVIKKLDPHSFYISSEDLELISEDMKGEFVGIGVSIFVINDTVNVIRPLEGGPSKQIGILAGDKILVANQDTLYGKNFTSKQIVDRLRGEEGTKVNVEVYRPTTNERHDFLIERRPVPISSVTYYLLNDETGYIQINRFAGKTSLEFSKAIQSLKSQGMTKLILDLRDNPGGYLYAAKQVANTFLEEGKLIVTVESNQGKKEYSYAKAGAKFAEGEVYVLINGQSASASEVVAGALQDNDRAWILGTRSYGKGLVQQQMPLGNDEALRLTIARYFTPTGRSIQRPFEDGNDTYYNEINARFNSGERSDISLVPKVDTLAFTTPKGRKVYGGGGITPDIYISSSATLEEEQDAFLLGSNLINYFVFNELDERRTDFEAVQRDEFIRQPLEDAQQWLVALQKYLIPYGIVINERNQTNAITAIKSYLALQLFDEEARIEVLNQQDEYVQKALEKLAEKN